MTKDGPSFPEFTLSKDVTLPTGRQEDRHLHDEIVGILLDAVNQITELLKSKKPEIKKRGRPQVPVYIRISATMHNPDVAQAHAIEDAYENGVLDGEDGADEIR